MQFDNSSDELTKAGIDIRILDPFTVKPIDSAAIIANAKECGGRIVSVEDHYAQGGLGEAVLSAVALERDIVVKVVAVTRVPRSGPPTALLDYFGISAKHIITAVQEILTV